VSAGSSARWARLRDRADVGHDDAVERLRRYLRQPSVSATGEGLPEAAALIDEHLQRLGFATRLVPTSHGGPVVIARRNRDRTSPTLLLYGHYDVQPTESVETWTSLPFAADVRDGRVFARGASDNKGQHFAHFVAIETLLDVEGDLPVNLVIVLDGEEEIGSPNLARVVRDHAADLDCDLVVAADGSLEDDGTPLVYLGCRGYLSFDLRATGATSDLHSGHWGDVAANPVWTLVQLLATMRAPDGTVTVAGLPAHRGENRRFALTINGISGGYVGPGSKAIVPRAAMAKCDMRVPPGASAADTLARVRAHVAAVAPEVQLDPLGGLVEAAATSLDSPWLPAVLDAVAVGQGRPARVVPVAGGTLPQHVWTDALGADTMIVPYANADGSTHAPDENLALERFAAGVRTSMALLVGVGEERR
jgi:acetylornithine deacetylase/succinyl-diaminopimelate desuccinylase-like protein